MFTPETPRIGRLLENPLYPHFPIPKRKMDGFHMSRITEAADSQMHDLNDDTLLREINERVTRPFRDLTACLEHFRSVMPERIGDYHQEEVGPIYPHDLPGEADRFVRREFHLGETTVDMSDGLDWFAAPGGDLEWNGGFVRHGYFVLLARAYRETGNEVYAETIVEHMLDYIARVPVFNPSGKPYLDYKKSTWRPFEVAARAAETWPEALAVIMNSPAMTPQAWGRILLSIHEHALFLRNEHWTTGNHATLEVAALGIIACFFMEFQQREAWLRYAVDVLEEMWPQLFAEDGYSREMSGSYHWVAMRSYFSFYEVACRNGMESLFSERYRQRLILNSYAELFQDKPDKSTPVSNDSSSTINRRRQLERMHALLGIPEIGHFLKEGKGEPVPEVTSCFYPYSRVGIMRSDWSPAANYLYFDMGPWGDNHMNQDQLSIEVSAQGRHFLVNGGKWRYTTSDPGAEWMPLAKYFKTTASYNCVLVNGYGQMFGDAEGKMVVKDTHDYADGRFTAGFGEEVPGTDENLLRTRGLATLMENRLPDVAHRRQVFFIKPWGWVLRDTIEGPGLTHAEQLWHFLEGPVKSLNTERTAWSTDFDDHNLLLLSTGHTTVYEGQREPFFAGWHCPYYDQLRPAPELRFRQEDGKRIVFHTLLLPVTGRVSSIPDFRIMKNGYKIEWENKRFHIHAPSDSDWFLDQSESAS